MRVLHKEAAIVGHGPQSWRLIRRLSTTPEASFETKSEKGLVYMRGTRPGVPNPFILQKNTNPRLAVATNLAQLCGPPTEEHLDFSNSILAHRSCGLGPKPQSCPIAFYSAWYPIKERAVKESMTSHHGTRMSSAVPALINGSFGPY